MADGMMDSMKNMAGMMSSDMMKKMEVMTKEMADDLSSRSGDDFDMHFIEMSIMHHQQAIDMLKIAESQAKHQEIKDMASEMIPMHQGEIEKMQRMQKDWGYME